ncbi:Eukaryotic translation initiation factor 3 subunit G [Mycena kentingensis (nom. inval.)]|nr:Eukaryotic translation initiation factor 3 subunit G [Mycena kentingensis (nom. inval.)]
MSPPSTPSAPKTSWADQVEEDEVDENGIRTTIEYLTNEDGKQVKVTRRTRRVLQKSVVDHAVAERLKWAKFGQEKGKMSGPDRATTTVGEEVLLKISAGNKAGEVEKVPEDDTKQKLAKAGAGKVLCRMCKGDHFTAKCPHKDALAGLELDPAANDDISAPLNDVAPVPAATTGKYVPPGQRPGARNAAGGPVTGSREDLPTLRVTNISEDTQENDLRELFGMFGRVARVYVGRDRETGAGKGFAFVSFEDRAVAQKAMEKVNGKGYDNLILSVQWSQPRPEQR